MTMRAMQGSSEAAARGDTVAGNQGAAHIPAVGARGNMAHAKAREASPGSVLAAEVARFDALASRWWDPDGPMRELHRMNPARTGWIDARLTRGARVLDVGCGAGIAAEALARRGHDVLGIDASDAALAAAEAHGAGHGLRLAYRQATAEALANEGVRFQAVLALEVIEHVADPAAFVVSLACLLAPGGRLFLSTINRTPRSFAFAKIGAEYVLRLLPVGTHDWRRFVTPVELRSHCAAAGLRLADLAGLLPDPLRGGWRVGRDLAVNYIAMAEGPMGA
jgi:2-polyprenyl-6-hydroxyphenyl methylase/3-demethylubiquinone-9 3-methyltransferase